MDPGSQKMTIGQVSPSKFESFKQSSDLTKKLSFRPNSSVSDSFWQGFCQFLPVFHLPQFLARFLSVSPSFPSFWQGFWQQKAYTPTLSLEKQKEAFTSSANQEGLPLHR